MCVNWLLCLDIDGCLAELSIASLRWNAIFDDRCATVLQIFKHKGMSLCVYTGLITYGNDNMNVDLNGCAYMLIVWLVLHTSLCLLTVPLWVLTGRHNALFIRGKNRNWPLPVTIVRGKCATLWKMNTSAVLPGRMYWHGGPNPYRNRETQR